MAREHLILVVIVACTCLLRSIDCQRSGASDDQARIQGCAKYRRDGKCRICKPGYQLRQGRCSCAPGWEKSGNTCKPGPCYQQCGKTNLKSASGGFCHCDYFCDNDGSCCGGSTSKNALCPHMKPTLDESQIANCNSDINKQSRSRAAARVGNNQYMPGVCWCDQYCAAAGDCCPQCKQACGTVTQNRDGSGSSIARTATVSISSIPLDGGAMLAPAVHAADTNSSSNGSTVQTAVTEAEQVAGQDAEEVILNEDDVAAVNVDSSTPLARQIAAEAQAAAAMSGGVISDCGAHRVVPSRPANESLVGIAQANSDIVQIEIRMQQCQAADKGPPAKPYIIPLHWTAGEVCRNGVCTGGKYSAATVRNQVAKVNSIYARAGIQFVWDGVIHTATAADTMDIAPCDDPQGRCWVCQQRRYGDQVAMNVMTSPTHVGGVSLGVTMYPSFYATGEMSQCGNWIYIYEKTLPGLGGRSLVDGGLSDGGGTLAHEIGHALMLRHTWFEEVTAWKPSMQTQCEGSASLNPHDILAGRSDGVRDTPAQSLNGSVGIGSTTSDVLRFVNCDVRTGAYHNTTAYAQQSCTHRVGFPQGSSYLNNVGNLMSYGDKTCLRTLTPGQGARARCALKCVRQGAC